uniref:7TM_GPCR_Srx domain-containing protein n=1 Tax=Heterorhabditis bacteriophora TaxID=37862 RepID=A0A1I7WQF9_HETBA
MGMVFIPSMMQWTFTIHEYSGVLYGMNRTSNYVVAIINVVIYPILFIVLYFKKNISLNNTKEIKMTVQVSSTHKNFVVGIKKVQIPHFQVFAMVFLELLFFSFWEFVPEINNLWIFLLIENSNLIYFDMLILPYLVLNR